MERSADVLPVAIRFCQDRLAGGIADVGQRPTCALQAVAVLRIVEQAIGESVPVGAHSRRGQTEFGRLLPAGVEAFRLGPLTNDPLADTSDLWRDLPQPLRVAGAQAMLADVPKNLAIARERVVQSDEVIQVALLQQVIEALSREFRVAEHVHSANDGRRLGI